jgi:hypothetical protein
MFLAQSEALCAVGGRKDGEPGGFDCPLHEVSKVVVVFDYQDGDGTLRGRCKVRSTVRRLSFFYRS